MPLKIPLNSTKNNRTPGWVLLSTVKLFHETRIRLIILLPGHSTGFGGVQQLLSTSPCLGALTSPSFRRAQHHHSGKCFPSVCLSASAPANQELILVNRIAVLYSSPTTASSGPCAMALFLQQAGDEMSKENLFSYLVHACKKALQATPNLQTLGCSSCCSLVPAWCYQQCPLFTLPSDSLASKARDPVLSQ